MMAKLTRFSGHTNHLSLPFVSISGAVIFRVGALSLFIFCQLKLEIYEKYKILDHIDLFLKIIFGK